jgi:hypothetical protein
VSILAILLSAPDTAASVALTGGRWQHSLREIQMFRNTILLLLAAWFFQLRTRLATFVFKILYLVDSTEVRYSKHECGLKRSQWHLRLTSFDRMIFEYSRYKLLVNQIWCLFLNFKKWFNNCFFLF